MIKRNSLQLPILFLIALINSSAYALDNTPTETYRATIQANAGNNSQELLDLLYPLYDNHNSLFFFDAQAVSSFNDTEGLNLGLAYRKLAQNQKHIFGIYNFVGRYRTRYDQYFYQDNLGAELLGKTYDFRSNIYIPFEKNKLSSDTLGLPEDGLPLIGHKIILQHFLYCDQSMPGFDIEVGRKVPFISGLKIYSAYYHYGVNQQASDINGVRFRMEYQVSPELSFTANEQYDHVYGNQVLVGVRINLGRVPDDHSAQLSDRMTDLIINRSEVVSQQITKAGDKYISPQNVYYVNNLAAPGGDGSYEHPFQTVQQALTAANNDPAGNIIYIYQGNGSYNLGGQVTLSPDLFFTGAGGNFIYQGVNLIPGSSAQAPILQGGLLVNNNDTLSNFNLVNFAGSGVNDGIEGINANNIDIDNVNVGSREDGQRFSRAFNFFTTNNAIANNLTIINSQAIADNSSNLSSNTYGIFIANYQNINISNTKVFAGNAATFPGSFAGTTGIELDNVTNAILDNVSIDNAVFGTFNNGYGLYVNNSNNINVNNLTANINGAMATGIELANTNGFNISNANISVTGQLVRGISFDNANFGSVNQSQITTNGTLGAIGILADESSNINLNNLIIGGANTFAIFANNNSHLTVNNTSGINGAITTGNLGNNSIIKNN